MPRKDSERIHAPCLVIEEVQIGLHEVDQPDLLGDFSDPRILSGEGLIEIDLALAEADVTAAGDRDGAIWEGILQLIKAALEPR